MQDLIIWDNRLKGPKPLGREVLEVDENATLSSALAWVVTKSAAYGGDVRVRILGHGGEPVLYERQVPDVWFPYLVKNTAPVVAQGGLGMWLCKENLSLQTVGYFRAWMGKVKKIDLLGCGVAYITPGLEGKAGDGNLLCMKLAQVTQAYVRASTTEQLYNFRAPIDFGPWEGTVLTYGPSGAVVKVEHSPQE
ncbi:MAG TPA: hypothetical protein VFA04_24915 [Bryobacteraceae bacterium]|nr:hypothetical protein [Bryobacteraceae bacterium]